MKKLLAALLALLLPCCALAEACDFELTLSVSSGGLSALFDLLPPVVGGHSLPAPSDSQAAALADFVSEFSLAATVDEETSRARLSLLHRDETLFDLQTETAEGADLYATSLLPGILLTTPADPALEGAWQQLCWDDFVNRLQHFAKDWEASLDVTMEPGTFAGDAYAGGQNCQTFRFDERDISVLLESMIQYRAQDHIDILLDYYGRLLFGDVNGLRNRLLERARQVSMQNRFNYVLRMVDDGSMYVMPLGVSLLVYENDQLVSTLSVGYGNEQLDIVLGYGIRKENVYLSLTIADEPADGESKLYAQFWRDPYQQGYYAASTANDGANLLLTVVAYAKENEPLRVECWDLRAAARLAQILVDATGAADGNLLNVSVTVSDQDLLAMRLSRAPAENLQPMERGNLQTVDTTSMTNEEAERLIALQRQSVRQFGVKMLELLPVRLLLYILENFL